jgi:AraC-like DNA-binding protein
MMLRRIEMSQGLMLATTSPLSEIALRCGMSDQSHFSRAFRRVMGETPDAWRRSRREMLLGGCARSKRSSNRWRQWMPGNASSLGTFVPEQ